MKPDTIHIFMQPEIRGSFWADSILQGIADAARGRGDVLVAHNVGDAIPELPSRLALVVGNSRGWLEGAVARCIELGARPVIVNAGMLPLRQFRCSGVVFELEEALNNCVRSLEAQGRGRTVLLGVNPDSATDQVKADAFIKASRDLDPNDIVWANDNIDSCTLDFVDRFDSIDCDSVICANDTVAICLFRLLRERGYRLPERLYIVGIGNSYVGARLALPLTSIMFDYHQMGCAAIRLYHQLRECGFDCNMTLSLPCRLVIRDSAPLNDVRIQPPKLTADTQPRQGYFDSDNARSIIRVESILQASDDIDREILYGITRGETCDAIAERLFFSDRAVRYRLSKLLRRYGYSDRSELELEFRRVFD